MAASRAANHSGSARILIATSCPVQRANTQKREYHELVEFPLEHIFHIGVPGRPFCLIGAKDYEFWPDARAMAVAKIRRPLDGTALPVRFSCCDTSQPDRARCMIRPCISRGVNRKEKTTSLFMTPAMTLERCRSMETIPLLATGLGAIISIRSTAVSFWPDT